MCVFKCFFIIKQESVKIYELSIQILKNTEDNFKKNKIKKIVTMKAYPTRR